MPEPIMVQHFYMAEFTDGRPPMLFTASSDGYAIEMIKKEVREEFLQKIVRITNVETIFEKT